ncbi:MAG: methyltransferase domain-containing protein, partial [Muribaculaceae bacterium]|nr:methyltransferase domain-containing protein [Muribaculaceae bacterium]
YAIADSQGRTESVCKWDRAYLATQDRIFPIENLERYWNQHSEVVKVEINNSHAVDLPKIIKDVIPDLDAIGDCFSSAVATYNANALVQLEICRRMGEIITGIIGEKNPLIHSLLEIGAGQGLLTETWRRILSPSNATFVDLFAMPEFGVTDNDEYIVADAEEWLKDSSTKYDVILSASTVQWFADPVGFIQTVKAHLNPCGFAVISTFVKGNLYQLDAIRPCPIIYRTAEEYKEIPGIEVEEWDRTLTFSSSREMLMHLRHTGVSPRRATSSVPLTALPTELTYRSLILIIGASPIHLESSKS